MVQDLSYPSELLEIVAIQILQIGNELWNYSGSLAVKHLLCKGWVSQPLRIDDPIIGMGAVSAPLTDTWLTDKTQKTLTPTPFPERERCSEPSVTSLASLLPLWEKGLRDEGARFCQSPRTDTLSSYYSVL